MNWSEIKKIASRIGLLTGAIFFLYQLFTALRSIKLSSDFPLFSVFFFFSFAAMFLVVGLQIFKWKYLLKSISVELSYRDLAKGYVISSLPKYIPGSIWGYLSRSQWLQKDYGVQIYQSNLANLFEIEITIISGITVLLIWASLDQYTSLGLIFTFIFPFVSLYLTQTIFHLLSKKKIPYLAIYRKTIILRKWRLLALLISFLEWATLGIATLLLINAFIPSTDLTLKTWLLALQSFTISWLGGFAIVLFPGGLGIREFLLTGLITTNFSLIHAAASLIAISTRIVYSFGEAIWILVGWMLKKKNSRIE